MAAPYVPRRCPETGFYDEQPDDFEPVADEHHVYVACDTCRATINRQAVGSRCSACRLAHGAPPITPNPYLVRVVPARRPR